MSSVGQRRLFLIVGAVVVTALSAELALAGLTRVTHSSRFDVFHLTNVYPSHPEQYLKIAVFGESSAAGWVANRSFADILEHELQGRLPKKLYVRNFAQPGATFDRDQAEVAKVALPYFDVILIYAGNNEIWIPSAARGALAVYDKHVDPLGGPTIPGDISRLNGSRFSPAAVSAWLQSRSRVFAVLKKLQNKASMALAEFRAPSKEEPPPRKPTRSADRKVVSDVDLEALGLAYERDVLVIKQAAAAQGKLLIVGTVATQLAWPPMFSRNGEAIGYYTAGMKALAEKKFTVAWDNLIKAKDEDGWPIRARSDINARIRSAMKESGNVADVEADVLAAVENGDTFTNLFVDQQHPSLRGQILIARSFLARFPDFASRSAVTARLDSLLRPGSLAVDAYRRELKIEDRTVVSDAMQNLSWLLNMRRYAVDDSVFVDGALRAWNRLEQPATARYEAGRAALLACTTHPDVAEIGRLLAAARARSVLQVEEVLGKGLPGLPADEIHSKFQSLGVER